MVILTSVMILFNFNLTVRHSLNFTLYCSKVAPQTCSFKCKLPFYIIHVFRVQKYKCHKKRWIHAHFLNCKYLQIEFLNFGSSLSYSFMTVGQFKACCFIQIQTKDSYICIQEMPIPDCHWLVRLWIIPKPYYLLA